MHRTKSRVITSGREPMMRPIGIQHCKLKDSLLKLYVGNLRRSCVAPYARTAGRAECTSIRSTPTYCERPAQGVCRTRHWLTAKTFLDCLSMLCVRRTKTQRAEQIRTHKLGTHQYRRIPTCKPRNLRRGVETFYPLRSVSAPEGFALSPSTYHHSITQEKARSSSRLISRHTTWFTIACVQVTHPSVKSEPVRGLSPAAPNPCLVPSTGR